MKKFWFAFVICGALSAGVFGQQPAPTPPTPPVEVDDVVKVTTSLIQVDAVVTGKDGKQVTDLTAEDFEIFQNGVKQKITNFSYVNVTAPTAPATETATTTTAPDKLLPPVPTRLKPADVRRTIALVVDDLGLSFESTHFVRQGLKKFVDEQMQPNDLVAIIRTGGGIGALQQFTSDKRQLYAAIEKVRWNPQGRGGVSAFAPIEATGAELAAAATGDEGDAERAAEDRERQIDFEDFRTDLFAVGTLGALNYIIGGMRELPGRKAVVLMSDGFKLYSRNADGNYDTAASRRVIEALRRLSDLANRASVVVNTIDARGLQTLGLNASDNTNGLNAEQLSQQVDSRRNELFDTQEGLIYLAAQTGGRSFVNNNDIKGSVEKVLDDQRGYYLLAYEPDDATFDPVKREFNKLTIKVVRTDLRVRYRSGFFGVTDAETQAARSVKQTAAQQITAALTSPFGASGVGLRVNALFGNDAKGGSFIRSLIHIQAKDLKFTDAPDGSKKATFDIVAYTFGDGGQPIDQVNQSYTFTAANEKAYRDIIEKGFVYNLSVPVKKPGAYQFRVALRDATSENIGSANQFVEVPNLKKNRLTLSGIVLQNLTLAQYQNLANQTAVPTSSQTQIDPRTDTALRRFRRGTVLQYAYSVYNAKTAARPQLETQVRVLRDGKPFYEGKFSPLDTAGQTDLQRVNGNGAITLPAQMPVGDYVLQVIVRDRLAKEKQAIAAQWVEFEVVN